MDSGKSWKSLSPLMNFTISLASVSFSDGLTGMVIFPDQFPVPPIVYLAIYPGHFISWKLEYFEYFSIPDGIIRYSIL